LAKRLDRLENRENDALQRENANLREQWDSERWKLSREIESLKSQLAISKQGTEILVELVERERQRIAYETAHFARQTAEAQESPHYGR